MEEKKEYVKLWLSYECYFEPYSDVEVGRLVRAMMKYKSSGEEPGFSGNERYVWPAIKRDIDDANRIQVEKSEKGRRNGAKGGRPVKATAFSEDEKNLTVSVESEEKQKNLTVSVESEKTHGEGKGKEKGKGKNIPPPLPPARTRDEGLGLVMSEFLDKINPKASHDSLEELAGYVRRLGAEVCLRAINKALDAGTDKANWNYMRGILRSLSRQKVTCLEDWDRLEAEREGRQHGAPEHQAPSGDGETTWDRLPGVTRL